MTDGAAEAGVPQDSSDSLYQAFLTYAGPYYVEKWKGLLAGTKSFAGFNVYAAIFGMAWFFYRRMFALGSAVFLAGILVALVSSALIPAPERLDSVTRTLVVVTSLAVFVRIPIGMIANVLYYRKAAWAVRRSASVTTPIDFLKSKGGVSSGGAVLAVILGLAFRLLIQALPTQSKAPSFPAGVSESVVSTAYREAGVIRDGLYVNDVVGIEVPIPDGYRAVPYTELMTQWKKSQEMLDLSKEEREMVKTQFHTNDILNLQVEPGAPAFANLRIIAAPQPLRDGTPVTARQQAADYFSELRHNPTLGKATAELKSEKPELVSIAGQEYYKLTAAVAASAIPRIDQVFLFTTHNGYNIAIVIAAMDESDGRLLIGLVERIRYKGP